MAFWWVNHKQTFKNEFEGGYIWSPMVNKNGSYNQAYTNLTLARVGDIVFSYADTFIKAIGVVEENYIEAAVPPEFGATGAQWNNDGYLVKVNWTALSNPLKPKDYIQYIKDLLPDKYSPIQQNGNGNQGIYLAAINSQLGTLLLDLIAQHNHDINIDIEEAEKEVDEVEQVKTIAASNISETEKEQLIKARRGQGLFRNRVINIEKKCRITGLTNTSFLIASHIKPWSISSFEEKLEGNNGLLLSPHIDRLFDKGFISFSNTGDVLLAGKQIEPIISKWHIPLTNVGSFNNLQRVFLEYHRDIVFEKAKSIAFK